MIPFLLILVSCMGSVQSRISFRLHGLQIDTPADTYLTFFDEIRFDPPRGSYPIPVFATGNVICISENRGRVGWHFTNGLPVPDAEPFVLPDGDFKQIRTEESVLPSMSRLSKNRLIVRNESILVNGLWSCRLNGRGGGDDDPTGGTFDEQVVMAIFPRGLGAVSRVSISSVSPPGSFLNNPPTFTLQCVISGGPPDNPNIWALSGENLENSDNYAISDIVVHGTGLDVHQNPQYSSTLTVTGNHPGDYECRVSNRNAASETVERITIEAGGLDIGNLTADQIDPTRAFVNWTASSRTPPKGYQLSVAALNITEYTQNSSHFLELPAGIHVIQVVPFTVHYPNEEMTVEVTVIGLSALNVNARLWTSTIVRISWFPPNPMFSLPLLRYSVLLARVTGIGQDNCSHLRDMRHAEPIDSKGRSFVAFTSLVELSVYRVTFTATFLGAKIINTTHVLEFSTPASRNSPTTTLLTITSMSVAIIWDACYERNEGTTGYMVELQDKGGALIPGELRGKMFLADNLTPGQSYTFRVAEIDMAGHTRQFSSLLAFSTMEETPGPVSNLISQPKLTAVVLTWSAPSVPNGVIIDYGVTYTVEGDKPVTTNTTHLSTTFTISSLTSQINVSDISVSAYTRMGKGEVTNLPYQTTLNIEITNVQVDIVGVNALRLSWDSIDIPELRGYQVYYNKSTNEKKMIDLPSSSNSLVFIYNKEYWFQVMALADLGTTVIRGQISAYVVSPRLSATVIPSTAQPLSLFIDQVPLIGASAFLASTVVFALFALVLMVHCTRQLKNKAKFRDKSENSSDDDRSDKRSENRSTKDSEFEERKDSASSDRSDSESVHRSDSESAHRSDSESAHRSDSESVHRSDSESVHRSDSESVHRSDSESVLKSDTRRSSEDYESGHGSDRRTSEVMEHYESVRRSDRRRSRSTEDTEHYESVLRSGRRSRTSEDMEHYESVRRSDRRRSRSTEDTEHYESVLRSGRRRSRISQDSEYYESNYTKIYSGNEDSSDIGSYDTTHSMHIM